MTFGSVCLTNLILFHVSVAKKRQFDFYDDGIKKFSPLRGFCPTGVVRRPPRHGRRGGVGGVEGMGGVGGVGGAWEVWEVWEVWEAWEA
jgi:hypothetical protein